MARLRGSLVRYALVAIATLAGCRGEHREPGPAPPPADEPLAWPAIDEPGLIAITATAGFTRGAPVPLAIASDGAVVFGRTGPRDASAEIYQLDASGKTRALATAATLLGADAAGAAIDLDAVTVSDDGARLLVPLAGRLFVIERATATARELAVGPHAAPTLSPDGASVAFVRDGDLWVAALGAPPVRVTQHPPDRTYATPDPDAASFGRTRGYWWSPDSQAIAFQRTDLRAVDTLYVGDPRHPDRAPTAIRRSRPGRPIATVDLGLVSRRGGAPRWVTWELARYPYLAGVTWPARGALTAIVVGRAQTQLAVLAIDPATAASHPLIVEKDPAWLNVVPDMVTWLADGSGFLWRTERDGAWSLDHRAADGTLVRAVVTADVGLRGVVGLSPDGRDVVLEASNDARTQHVWRVPLAGGDATALTTGDGVHRAWARRGVLVIRSERQAGGQATIAIRADGTRVELPSVAEHPALAPTTKLETVTIEDHTQHTAVTRPRAFDPKVRYPVMLRVDGDPDRKLVVAAADRYALDQWYADAGFIVVRSDGRGTPDRDRAWQRTIAGDVLTIPMNDQLGALKQLGARYPELDLARVGAYGAGLGGGLAAIGAMIHPDAFAAAVAIAPITDWELVGAAYGERYMKAPAINAEGYRRTSAATYAEQLTRPLLLIHGVTDEPIGFAHSLALIDRVSAAGKPVQLATLAATGDAALEATRARLALEFLRAHLGPPVRPAVMPAPRSEEEEEERERERERGSGK